MFAVTVLGSSGMFPTSERACAGYLVEIGDKKIWLDAGSGSWRNLVKTCSYAELDGVILTHRHPDHHSALQALVAVTGASNVTGEIWPLSQLAAIAHHHGAELFADAAQLAPHRAIDMARAGIDHLALSGHKLYAPYGAGALIGERDWLTAGDPFLSSQADVLYQWQCEDINGRIGFLEFLSQRARQVAQGLPFGEFQRFEVYGSKSRALAQVDTDHAFLVRTNLVPLNGEAA